MRLRPIAAVSTIAVSMLLLAGCGATAEPDPTPAAADDLCAAIAEPGEASEAVSVEGDPGQPATATFTAPLEFTEPQVSVIAEGEGEPIEAGEFVSFAFTVYNATTGEEITSAGYQDGEVLPSQVSADSALGQMIGCAAPGQRVVATVPATESYDAEVYVLDVLGTVPGVASGEPQEAPEGMPEVSLAEDGTPSVTVGDTATPDTTQIATLQKGDGVTVAEGDLVMLQYHGVRVSDGEVFDSTWDGGVPISYQTTGFVEGFQKALVGQTVGSQVLAVIPPAEGYGEGEINAENLTGETLVFVVDILGAQHVQQPTTE
ncbi:FKBP-type peptidyl-prolyl cis-trans isomerase [Microbacterium sp. MC2]